jgi:hypothetical protein
VAELGECGMEDDATCPRKWRGPLTTPGQGYLPFPRSGVCRCPLKLHEISFSRRLTGQCCDRVRSVRFVCVNVWYELGRERIFVVLRVRFRKMGVSGTETAGRKPDGLASHCNSIQLSWA